jgi:lipoyl(octanoyl) transferase
MKPRVHFRDFGRAAYRPVWEEQERLFAAMLERKSARRKAGMEGGAGEGDLAPPDGHLFFVEHSHVFTLGKSGDAGHLLADAEVLAARGAEYVPINRGGDITYHGPGQLVGYPLLDLEQFFTDIGRYMRTLEEAIVRTCADYGLATGRIAGLTGVWVDPNLPTARKIAALGVKSSRWVTMHGFAFNVDPDLSYFGMIVPCGIVDRGVTSLAREIGRPVTVAEVAPRVQAHLTELFGWELIEDTLSCSE